MADVKREKLNNGDVKETKTYADGSVKIVTKTEGFLGFGLDDKIKSVERQGPSKK